MSSELPQLRRTCNEAAQLHFCMQDRFKSQNYNHLKQVLQVNPELNL